MQTGVASRDPSDCSVIEMGGRGAVTDMDTLATEVAIRGFWTRYQRQMAGVGRAESPEAAR